MVAQDPINRSPYQLVEYLPSKQAVASSGEVAYGVIQTPLIGSFPS
jgi:hypothetical protein